MNISIPVPDGLNEDLRQMFRSLALEAIQEAKDLDTQMKPYMTQQEACKAIGVSFNTLQNFRRQGLKVSCIEGKTLISRETLIKFMTDHEI